MVPLAFGTCWATPPQAQISRSPPPVSGWTVVLALRGEGLRRAGWEMSVQGGAGDAGFLHDLGDGVAFVAQVFGVGQFGGVDHAGSAGPPALAGGDGSGVGGAFDGVGAFHLAEEGEHDHGQLGHRVLGVGGVDPDGVGQVPHADAAVGEVVDEVQGVPHGAAQSVQGVHDDHVPLARLV